MPAEFYHDFFHYLEEAIVDVGNGLRKVTGKGYSVYRVGATIRCDLKPEWVPGEEENVAPEAPSGRYEPPWVEPERRGGDV